ncbi:hypothetical protein BDP27DRAFT_18026 [Rhodocollybia butyracea]|uniref:C2H2-type domain-containing protein n=1 Tax=Rhodocollybia butyracea TaxID=206335 RepID=A0A9P5UGM6_9AGAR|nr:hypothetical protein BDP27DRAFT_18026 [Rhodocollybia butyracea]
MATTATQPISLGRHGRHSHNSSQDVNMISGSYNSGEGGSFNPASYTRHFLGSPMSFPAVGSYGNRLLGYPGSVGSITMGSPTDREVANVYKVLEFQEDLCRNYYCCGIHLNDLHALLEHFEEVHVICIDQEGGEKRISVPFQPQMIDEGGIPQPLPSARLQQQSPQPQQMHQGGGPVDPDDMELEMPPSSDTSVSSSMPSSPTSTPSPPETLLATPHSAYSSPSGSSLAAAYPGGYPGLSNQKSLSSSPPSPQRSSANHSSQHTDRLTNSSSMRPSLALNLAGFSSSTASRPALHSPFITGPPPPGGATWTHSHGAPGGIDMTYTGNIGGLGMAAFGGNFDYQSYAYNFPQAPVTDSMASDSSAADMGCVQPALLFSTPSSPQSYQEDGESPDDEDADAEFDIEIEDHNIAREVKKEKGATKTSPPKGPKIKGQFSVPSSDSNPNALGTSAAVPASTNSAAGAASGTTVAASKSTPRIGRPPTGGGSSGLLQSKPFKCPKPNCNKSYKQANGLKYHMTHGSCNFAPPKDLEHVQAILDRKRKQQQQQSNEDAPSSAPSSGANTPRSGMASPVPSPFFAHGLSINTGVTPGSNSSSAVSSPVAASSGSHLGTSNFTPTPSSLSTALSTALSLSSPTSATPSYTENTYQDGDSSTLHSYAARTNTMHNTSSSSLINALTPVSSTNEANSSTPTSLRTTLSDLSSLPASERMAIEAEAERQLKPYACGVGDCPRRYKNMNGLRYHYQHSGDHGAIGLQWLASGKHECLSQRGDKSIGKAKIIGAATGSIAYPSTGRVGGAEREGRKVRGTASSNPNSRASSVSAVSRTGTPVNATFSPSPYAPSPQTAEISAQGFQSNPQFSTQPLGSASPTQTQQTPPVQYQQTHQFSPQPTNASHPSHPNYQLHLRKEFNSTPLTASSLYPN